SAAHRGLLVGAMRFGAAGEIFFTRIVTLFQKPVNAFVITGCDTISLGREFADKFNFRTVFRPVVAGRCVKMGLLSD
ncbi:MAG: hypothetical protein N0E55_14435, partial [Candidatus Thiodiazotropha taylori]|nr:hypothetical protein [Candidatus Thiodiazotropha taylori]MCW4253880.1 hypothetical protein [Candidatus Thiodiazotropha taylori]